MDHPEKTANGHTMLDGATEIVDKQLTQKNKELVKSFVETILIKGQFDKISTFYHPEIIQHNPFIDNAVPGLIKGVEELQKQGVSIQIEKIHRGRPDGRLLPPEGACHPEIARTGLTPREVDVLGLIAAGLTNQEIADRLYLSINSVKTYIRTAYRKIGAERRAHAVVWVERHALTPPPTGPAADRDDVAAE